MRIGFVALPIALLASASNAFAQPAPVSPAPPPPGALPLPPTPPVVPQPSAPPPPVAPAPPVTPQPQPAPQLQPAPQPWQSQPPLGPLPPASPYGVPRQTYGQPSYGPQVRFGDATDLARLDQILHRHASNGRYYGIAVGVSSLVTATVAVPTGIHMLKKADNPIPGAIVLGLGIGSAIGGIISFFVTSSDLDALARSLEDKKEAGEPAELIVPEIEQEWREKARSTKTSRTAFGVVGVALGGIAMGVGTGFAIAEPIGGIDRTEQQALGAALLGLGASTAIAGFAQIFLETPIESTWDVYSSFKAPSMPPMMIQRPNVSFVPLGSPYARSSIPIQGGAIAVSGTLW